MNIDPSGNFPWLAIGIAALILVGSILIVNHGVSLIECAIVESKIKDTYTKEEAKEKIEEITGKDTVNFSETNLEIKNSFEIKSRYQRILIFKIIHNTVNEDGKKYTSRNIYGLSAEWVGHNVLVHTGIKNTHQTRNVNLDYNFSDNDFLTEFGTIALMILGVL